MSLFLTFFTLAAAAPAQAGDPTLPLSQVQTGMRCTGLSVIKGTEVSAFNVEVLDVVGSAGESGGPRILIRVSGPAVESTGIGPGFSGSPIYCTGADGVARNAGAISESIGQYGNTVALATPIESILGQPPNPPAGANKLAKRARASVRRLAGPLTFSGLARPVSRAFAAAAATKGITVLQSPTGTGPAAFPVQQLGPGSSAAASLSSGDVIASSIGTVAYVDGVNVWLFGHGLDNAGPRSLFLQDAFVYSVIGNPLGLQDLVTYKLAAPGHNLGIVTNDTDQGTVGSTGASPTGIPMRIDASDEDRGVTRTTRLSLADESGLAQPSGVSPLSQVGPLAVASAANAILGANPSRQSGSMCVRMRWREVKEPVRFCNSYVASADPAAGLGGAADLMTQDFQAATTAIDAFAFAPIHVTDVEVGIRLRRGLSQAFLAGGSATPARRGGRSRLKLRLDKVGGGSMTLSRQVKVPGSAPRGRTSLTLIGTAADQVSGGDEQTILLDVASPGDEESAGAGDPGPRTAQRLADTIRGLGRADKLNVRVGGRHGPDASPIASHGLRISGRITVPIRVR